MRKNKSKYDRRSYHSPTYRLILQNEGCKWMPSHDKRDNIATNYNSNNIIEIVYQKRLKNIMILYYISKVFMNQVKKLMLKNTFSLNFL